jgi:hypothetical protein
MNGVLGLVFILSWHFICFLIIVVVVHCSKKCSYRVVEG